MSNETMNKNQKKIWDKATESEYVRFDRPANVLFVTGDISVVKNNNVESYEFDVIQTLDDEKLSKILGTRSKGLLRGLYEYSPLAGKTFEIERTGEGYQTEYIIEEVSTEEVPTED